MERFILFDLIRLELDPVLPDTSYWSSSPELIFCIEGTADVICHEYTFHLHSEDILILNAYSLHRIAAYSGHMACLRLDYERFSKRTGADPSLSFRCDPGMDRDRNPYHYLQEAVAHFLFAAVNSSPDSRFTALTAESFIFMQMVTSFSEKHPLANVPLSAVPHIQRAIDYISGHYREPIRIQSIAEACHINDTYLSHLFQRYLGITPYDFLTRIRLDNSLPLLLENNTLTTVADETGFPSLRSYNAAFQKEYGMAPREYREIQRTAHSVSSSASEAIRNIAKKYMAEKDEGIVAAYPSIAVSEKREDGIPAPHIRLLHCGFTSSLLDKNRRDEIASAQADFKYTDIFLSCILDYPMVRYIVHGDQILWDFSVLDDILDDVISLGMNPFLNINSIPEILAPAESSQYFGYSNCSLPEESEKWLALLKDLFLHFRTRYGETVLSQWHVCIWTSPDDLSMQKSEEDLRELFHFLYISCETVRSVCPDIQVSGPHMALSGCEQHRHFIEEYLQNTFASGFRPDFLAFFVSAKIAVSYDTLGWRYFDIEMSADHYRRLFDHITEMTRQIFKEKLPLCFTAIDGSGLSGDLFNDTAFAAANHVAALSEAANYSNMFGGLWIREGRISSSGDAVPVFHGGSGLVTAVGLPRALWYAERLFQALRGEIVFHDDRVIVTRDGQNIQVLAVNVQSVHYRIRQRQSASNALSHFVLTEMVAAESDEALIPDPLRRNERLPSRELTIRLPLLGLASGRYEKTEYVLNRGYGSAFDAWVAVGGTEPDKAEIEYLMQVAQPRRRRAWVTVADGAFVLERELEPDEVWLVELRAECTQ